MQGQSQQAQNLISLFYNGIDGREKENFIYKRVDTELDETCHIEMDETDHRKPQKLAEKGTTAFQYHAGEIIGVFCK